VILIAKRRAEAAICEGLKLRKRESLYMNLQKLRASFFNYRVASSLPMSRPKTRRYLSRNGIGEAYWSEKSSARSTDSSRSFMSYFSILVSWCSCSRAIILLNEGERGWLSLAAIKRHTTASVIRQGGYFPSTAMWTRYRSARLTAR